jgi:hypothetical protein
MTPQKKEFFVLLFIIIVAAFLRFSDFTQFPPGLYPDEAMNGSNALEANATGHYKAFYPENNGREGLFINIQAIFLKSFLAFSPFPVPWMLHVPSALFGIFTVLGIYFLTKELPGITNKYVPLLAAFFTATSFWHINFSRIGFRAIMAPFFLVWGVWFLLFSLRKQKENTKTVWHNWVFPLLAGIVYGLGMHSYIAYRGTPLLILVVLIAAFFLYEKKIVFRVGSLFILGSILISLPLIFYFIQNPQDFLGRTTQVSIFSSGAPLQNLFLNSIKTMGMFFVYGDSNWRHNLSGNPEIFFPVAICFGLALLLGVIALIKKHAPKRITYILLFAWFAAGAGPVVVSNEGIPHALRSILLIPPAYILAALGAEAFYEFLKRKNIRKDVILAVSFLFLTTTLFNAYYTYFVIWGENKNTRGAFAADYVKIANEINVLPRTVPKYIIVEAGGTDVRGYPMPAQTTMFLTESFLPQERAARNIHYIFPSQENEIPPNAAVFEIK